MQFGVRHALACRIARQTEVYRTFALKLHHHPPVTSYLTSTALVALPPRLLRTVMFCGLVETLNSPRYCPPPLLPSVPISAPDAVLKTCNVALEFVLVASTRKMRLPESNSARVILTVSV